MTPAAAEGRAVAQPDIAKKQIITEIEREDEIVMASFEHAYDLKIPNFSGAPAHVASLHPTN